MTMLALETASRFIKEREGCRLEAYGDIAGVMTCGWGSTGPDIKPDTVWTQEQADTRLLKDLSGVILTVRRAVKTPITDSQCAALASFAYNVGEGAFLRSTLLALLNNGQVIDAAKQFVRWDQAGGKEVKGLLRRRFLEAALFLEG